MLYNKTEERVLSYLHLLKKRLFNTVDSDIKLETRQFKERTDEPVSERVAIKDYPFGFGCQGEDTCFYAKINIPDTDEVFLVFPIETDSLLFVNGEPYSNVNPNHNFINIKRWRGQSIDILVRAWGGYIYPGTNPIDDYQVLTVLGHHQKSYPIFMGKPYIAIRNLQSYNLYYDLLALTSTLKSLPQNNLQRQRSMSVLHEALMELHLSEDDVKKQEYEASCVRNEISILLQAQNGTFCSNVFTVGMAHLDHAWLWPMDETYRKSDRTISGMVTLCEEFPEFVFLCTQPIQMERTFERYPVLYARVLKAFQNGQWEPNGVGLVEADNVLTCGEGLIRNLIYGRETTRKLFPDYIGDSYIVPDSFGYNGNLPQILRGCGVKYFITSKLSWNDTNRFPFDSFIWRGIDGSEIKSHMIQGAYNGKAIPSESIAMWEIVQHKDVQSGILRTIGEGDGGGGTSRDDLEIVRRISDLQGCPKTKWSTVSRALDTIFADARNLPVYQGELYFELHRGTYTSQARMKQGYRHTTTLLHNIEYLLCERWACGKISDEHYNNLGAIIHDIWKETVINQFHDILPGSSVNCVYQKTDGFYKNACTTLWAILRDLVPSGSKSLNLSPFVQYGIKPYSSGESQKKIALAIGKQFSVSWGTICIDENGAIKSIVWKGRELVGHGPWNEFKSCEDIPLAWDAWDIEKDSVNQLGPIAIPAMDFIRYGKLGKRSILKQRMVVYENNSRIDFITEIDWHENHTLLKACFPVAMNSDRAIFDIPFGFITRSTLENTTIEQAQFESPAQKFVCMQDENVTVALMSDSKYGYSAKNNELNISLLRSPKAPDCEADMGKHSFVYSILITEHGIKDVIAQAEGLNNPVIETDLEFLPLIVVSQGLAVETVKPAEDKSCIVFRVREYLGTPVVGEMRFATCLDEDTLIETNMQEEPIKNTGYSFRPFEIKSYKISRKQLSNEITRNAYDLERFCQFTVE